MNKADFGRLFLFASISAFSCRAPADPLVDRAEAFRAELSARNMIVGRDPELGAARATAAMIKYFTLCVWDELQTVRFARN